MLKLSPWKRALGLSEYKENIVIAIGNKDRSRPIGGNYDVPACVTGANACSYLVLVRIGYTYFPVASKRFLKLRKQLLDE